MAKALFVAASLLTLLDYAINDGTIVSAILHTIWHVLNQASHAADGSIFQR